MLDDPDRADQNHQNQPIWARLLTADTFKEIALSYKR